MKKINVIKAFTLAEVLVTLMIIGVIAAVTIPGLKKSTEDKERVTLVKKAYSTVSNATAMLQNSHGPIRHWRWGDRTVIMDNMYIPYFNVSKNCKNEGGCFEAGYRPRSLNGGLNNDFQSDKGWYTFATADGMLWAVGGGTADCSYNESNYIKNGCMGFEVDVNGLKKPNQMGVDIFGFIITKEGAYPFGGCPGCTDVDCKPNNGNGWGCTAKLIREGKFSW